MLDFLIFRILSYIVFGTISLALRFFCICAPSPLTFTTRFGRKCLNLACFSGTVVAVIAMPIVFERLYADMCELNVQWTESRLHRVLKQFHMIDNSAVLENCTSVETQQAMHKLGQSVQKTQVAILVLFYLLKAVAVLICEIWGSSKNARYMEYQCSVQMLFPQTLLTVLLSEVISATLHAKQPDLVQGWHESTELFLKVFSVGFIAMIVYSSFASLLQLCRESKSLKKCNNYCCTDFFLCFKSHIFSSSNNLSKSCECTFKNCPSITAKVLFILITLATIGWYSYEAFNGSEHNELLIGMAVTEVVLGAAYLVAYCACSRKYPRNSQKSDFLNCCHFNFHLICSLALFLSFMSGNSLDIDQVIPLNKLEVPLGKTVYDLLVSMLGPLVVLVALVLQLKSRNDWPNNNFGQIDELIDEKIKESLAKTGITAGKTESEKVEKPNQTTNDKCTIGVYPNALTNFLMALCLAKIFSPSDLEVSRYAAAVCYVLLLIIQVAYVGGILSGLKNEYDPLSESESSSEFTKYLEKARKHRRH